MSLHYGFCSRCGCYLSPEYHYSIKEFPGETYCARCYEALHFHCSICKNFKLRYTELDDSDYAELRGLSKVCTCCANE